jgi:hypothetical protein
VIAPNAQARLLRRQNFSVTATAAEVISTNTPVA